MKENKLRNPLAFVTSRFDDEDEEELLCLLGHMWKDYSEQERRYKFEWRYKMNPFQNSSPIYLSRINNIIAGFRAFVPQEAMVDSHNFPVYSPADAIVHPDYRRKGIFSTLNNAFLEDVAGDNEIGFILNLSSNDKSTPGYLKLGWIKTNSLKSYAYKISLINFLKQTLIKKETISKKDNLIKRDRHLREYQLCRSIEFSAILDFRERNGIDHSISINRSLNFYQWRYLKSKGSFFYCTTSSNNQLDGYMILSCFSKNQFIIEEFHCISWKVQKRLLNFIQTELDIPIIRMPTFNNTQKEFAKRSGMILETKFLLKVIRKKRLPVLIRSTKKEPKNEDYFINGRDIRDLDNWILYASDVH